MYARRKKHTFCRNCFFFQILIKLAHVSYWNFFLMIDYSFTTDLRKVKIVFRTKPQIWPQIFIPRVSRIDLQSTLVVSKSILFLVAWWRWGHGGRKSGKNVERTRREARNFSRAKYHADWLEVMKFWWLIKCKKIYRLRPLCFSPPPSLPARASSSLLSSAPSFLLLRFAVPPPGLRTERKNGWRAQKGTLA